jgi:hypothetical protein
MSRWRLELILCGYLIFCAVTSAQMNVAEITGTVQDMAAGARDA